MIDTFRGLTLFSMVLYHLSWSLVYLWHMDWQWYRSDWAYLWQQTICWSFIFISGFSWNLGSRPLRRGMVVFLAGWVITGITTLATPDQRILFGILTMLGSSMLLTLLLRKPIEKIPPAAGLSVFLLLFLVTRNIPLGHLGFEGLHLMALPDFLYRGYFMTYLGFPQADFSSADYFPLFPWYFLYLCGYFSYLWIVDRPNEKGLPSYFTKGLPLFGFLGRHSLLIYMIHQPIIIFVLFLIFR